MKPQERRKQQTQTPNLSVLLRRSQQGVPAGSAGCWGDPAPGAGCQTLAPSSALPRRSPNGMKRVHPAARNWGSAAQLGRAGVPQGGTERDRLKAPSACAGCRDTRQQLRGCLRQRPAPRHTYRPGGRCPAKSFPGQKSAQLCSNLPATEAFCLPSRRSCPTAALGAVWAALACVFCRATFAGLGNHALVSS